MLKEQRIVRQTARALARSGLVTAYGHCSLRLNDREFLVCAAKPMGLIRPQDDGTVVPVVGDLPTGVLGEVRAHQQIYKLRSDVNAICRIASPKLFSLSGLGRTPSVRHGFGAYFAPSAPFWPDTQLLRSEPLAAALAAKLGSARAILMRGNGAIVVGDTLPQALVLAWFFEDAARVELDILACGGGSDALCYTEQEAATRATFEGRVVERMWDYLTDDDPENTAS